MRNVDCMISVLATPEFCIRAFTDPEMLGGWWNVERSFIDLQKGGNYTLAWGISDQGIRYISTGIIKEFEPGRILHVGEAMYLNPERPFLGPVHMIVTTTTKGDETILRVQQGPYPEDQGGHWEWYYESVKEAWPKVLLTLKKYLESNKS